MYYHVRCSGRILLSGPQMVFTEVEYIMPIFVDDREPEEVIKGLRRQNLAVEIHHNDSGDYVFGEVAIERKTISDLIGSVCSKKHRLWDQLGTMKDTYQQPMLLVEGMINWKDPYLSGILTTVLLFWKYQTIFTLGMEETALAVGHLFVKFGIGRSGRLPPAAVKKQFTPTEIMREMLQCIEGIGPKTAHRILEEIPLENFTTLDIFNLDEELRQVKGLPARSRGLITQVFRGGIVE